VGSGGLVFPPDVVDLRAARVHSPSNAVRHGALDRARHRCGTPSSTESFVAALSPARRRRDVSTLLEVYARATQSPPHLSRHTVGYGALRQAGDGVLPEYAARFSLRPSAICIHLVDGVRAHAPELRRLGAHTVGVGHIRITSLSQVDLGVLERIIRTSYMTSICRARAGQAALSTEKERVG